jgi:S1-C subfamily serine protease
MLVAQMAMVAVLLLLPLGDHVADAQADSSIEATAKSVVTVYAYASGGSFSPGATGREPSGAGSGWVLDGDGRVVTNAHVVSGAERIVVVTAEAVRIPAKLIGSDWYQDVALLQLEPDDGQQVPQPTSIGNSDNLNRGDDIVAIGTPGGLYAGTVTNGVVVAHPASLNTGVGYTLFNLIQHSAALRPGNSGGPLVTTVGDVVGMNVASRDVVNAGSDDVSYAIDINTVLNVTNALATDGSMNRPYIGLSGDLEEDGLVVDRVIKDSPASDSGIQPGDVVLAVDATEVTRSRPFIDTVYQHDPGDQVSLSVKRDGEVREIEIELALPPHDD